MRNSIAARRSWPEWLRTVACVAVGLAAYGCTESGHNMQPTAPNPGRADLDVGKRPRPRYAPKGVAFPDTGIFTLIPEPLTPGDPEPKPTKERNMADLAHNLHRSAPPTSRSSPLPSTAGNNDSWRGWVFNGAGTMRGIYAGFDVVDDPIIRPAPLPRGWVFYAPTALPHGRSCLEVTNVHFEDPPGAGVSVWNWCSGDDHFAVLNAINVSSWRSKYARPYIDPFLGTIRNRYFIMVFAENPAGADGSYDTWWALIYNWNAGAWEVLLRSTGIATRLGDADGWLYHETRNVENRFDGRPTGLCYTLRSTAASDVALRDSDGSWMAPGNFPSGINFDFIQGGAIDCFGEGHPYTFDSWITWGWIAATPVAQP